MKEHKKKHRRDFTQSNILVVVDRVKSKLWLCTDEMELDMFIRETAKIPLKSDYFSSI